MIEHLLKQLTETLDKVTFTNGTCHVPDRMFSYAEQELLLNLPYKKRTPPTYPADRAEKLGARSIKFPFDGIYHAIRLRGGLTELHIASAITEHPIKGIALLYMGEAETLNVIAEAKMHLSDDGGVVLLLDNGVISASYASSKMESYVIAHSFHPPENSTLADKPYPTSELEIDGIMKLPLIVRGMSPDDIKQATDTKAFRAIQDLVLLCKDVYLEVARTQR
jgi:hypothetical protein